MMFLRREDGFAILPFSVVMAAIMASIFMFASNKSKSLIEKVGRSQGTAYGNELSVKFAQRLRWSYDAARADALNPTLGLCASYGGTTKNMGAFRLCLTDAANGICVKHPQAPNQKVCINPNASDPTLYVTLNFLDGSRATASMSPKRVSTASLLQSTLGPALIPAAEAQNIYSPPEPSAAITTNSLTVSTTNCIGGNCRAVCGGPGQNADCVTYKFCPLVGTCSANQLVWQTLAFIRTP